jgi:hypothetical protein
VISSANATTIDLHIAAIGPAQLLQPLHEGVHAALRFRIVCREIMSTPMRRIFSRCCARTVSGHAAAPPISVMNWRRLRSSMGYIAL